MEKKWVLAGGVVLVLLLAVFSFQGGRAVKGTTAVALYNSVSIGVVEKTLTLELNEGLNNVPLKELEGLNVAEVTIMSPEGVEVLGIFSRGTNENAYSANVGGEVEIKLDTGETIKGKFYGIKDGKLVVEGEDYYLIDPAKVVYFKPSTLDESSVYAVLRAEKKGEYNVTVIYRVGGINWKSRYKLYIGERAKLQGYVVITNPTAVELESADVLLVAGDVQLYQTLPGPREVHPLDEKASRATVGEPQKLEAFYIYTLGTVNINPSSTMVYPYVSMEVPFQREYLYESWPTDGERPVYESISFKTDKVLPAGIVEVYRESGGKALLIGERSIEHTPKGDVVRIGLGRDYDLKGRTTVLSTQRSDHRTYYKIRIEIENFGNETKTVIIRHHKNGKLLSSSVEPIDETASYVEFSLTVNPGEKKEVVFEYEVEY
ncbi:DUF4139 domain-containing protein [Thermococcus stetteri]|uniref:DUF4139 domain-containing protein n=1 Tax=Thermococcus stetteri TaxID=49900 RepID=UPI001AE70EE9|nr:DUF4139 domain-containing protein [Thermococcus stetteri]MBP1912238.1 hypothetical protein [Thermococcus stetteri]